MLNIHLTQKHIKNWRKFVFLKLIQSNLLDYNISAIKCNFSDITWYKIRKELFI